MSLMFGEYVEIYTGVNTINKNDELTISAIALYPSGNLQQRWMFLSLNTGRVIHRHQWKRLPLTRKIINRVQEMGAKEKQSFISNNFRYKWSDSTEDKVSDTDNDSTGTRKIKSENEEGHVEDSPLIHFHEISDEINEITEEQHDIDLGYTNDDDREDVINDAVGVAEVDKLANEVEPDHVASNQRVTTHEENIEDEGGADTPQESDDENQLHYRRHMMRRTQQPQIRKKHLEMKMIMTTIVTLKYKLMIRMYQEAIII